MVAWESVDELRGLACKILPNDVGIVFLGEADTLEESSREVALTDAIAALVVFLVLCVQFEGVSRAVVVMTTVLGGLPLILSSDPGAEARAAIGWVMFGSLGLAALFTLYLTPVVYLGLGASINRVR